MKVDKSDMKGLFDATVTFVVPLFQRAYVWDEERWGTLWEDIEKTTEAALEGHDGQHFLGAVVLEQVSTPAGRMYQRQVIDGQQRMVTLQLLLLVIPKMPGTSPERTGRGSRPCAFLSHKVSIDDSTPASQILPHTDNVRLSYCAQ